MRCERPCASSFQASTVRAERSDGPGRVAFARPETHNHRVHSGDSPCRVVKIIMPKTLLAQMLFAAALVAASCGRDSLSVSGAVDASPDQARGAGGSPGFGGAPGFGGGLGFQLPDGGLSFLFADGGLLGGILDAPRDNLLGQILCGPEVRLGASCSSDTLGCVLPSLGGLCACVSGAYICPLNTGPAQECPRGAATGTRCLSPLSACLGGSGVGCVCGLGTYTCL
jgi:hypothetical protein